MSATPICIESPDAEPPIDHEAVLSWFTRKARDRAAEALRVLEEARGIGHWPPGISRGVRAVLNKQTVAQKFAKPNDRDRNIDRGPDLSGLLDDVCSDRLRWYASEHSGRNAVHAMMFGHVASAPAVAREMAMLGPHVRCEAERVALDVAIRWARDFSPVAALIECLDAARPDPRYVLGEVTKSVLQNLREVVEVDFRTVRVPDVIWQDEKMTIDGREITIKVGQIQWPADTRFGRSKFGNAGTACEACGHGIRTNNWVPLLLDGDAGPAGLWVGRDCARHLLGVRIQGEGTIRRTPTPA